MWWRTTKSWSRRWRTTLYYTCLQICDPTNYEEAAQEEKWKKSMCVTEALRRNEAQELVALTKVYKILSIQMDV